jgi:hypothetical protein
MKPARRLTAAALAVAALAPAARGQSAPPAQPIDQEYTAKIKEYLQDARITTELVDHLPASSTVPTPLKFHGRIVGTPGELTYAKDIHRYLEAIAKASPRARYWKIGTTEEGRDIVVLAIADEQTIASLDQYRDQLKALTDPRRTSEAQARQLLGSAKPIYWLTSGMHSPETGGPETLQELAYRLVVEETPFVQEIRKNVITFITPVLETDGREKVVDTYYFNKKRPASEARLPLMYWGKYVQHDNNRDGMGQFLALTRAVTRTQLEWVPTILHDLHEAQSYLYSSTGTGPYNEALDPITVNEWWTLANNDVLEMTKRGVPGVFTYGFYDGWVPNYMFFIAHSHNAIGRFYEVQSYGPDNNPDLRLPATTTSREWFRTNPPLPSIKWGPRNNVNIQQSAILLSLNHVARNKATYLENYWLKNRRAVDKAKAPNATVAWVVPAAQRRKANAAEAINELRRQGLEVHTATSAFQAGGVQVQPGDYVIRGDQPYRTLAEMYFSLQNYPVGNPAPYDDTGWTFQLMRDVVIRPVTDQAVLGQQLAAVTADVRAPGGVEGTGPVLVVEHAADNNLMTFRFKNAAVKMQAAEADFEAGGRRFKAGAIIVPNANRARLEPMLKELGLSAVAVATAPDVKAHDLDVPRIGYVHSWARTQDEGWVRAALDTYGVPYTYFADQKLKSEPNLRAKYDVIIFPHVGGTPQSMVAGIPKTGALPLPYRKTAETPNLGFVDQTDDIRGGMEVEGLMNLYKFVQDGGTLITEGATSTIFPEYNLTAGVTVEPGDGLFARGSILRGLVTDRTSPLAYGFDAQLPVYFNQAPVLSVAAGGAGGFGGGGRGAAGLSQNITPNATPLRLSPWDSTYASGAPAGAGRGGRGGAETSTAEAGRANTGRGNAAEPAGPRPRVIMQFPTDANEMLLSGTLNGGQALSGRAQLVDAPVGKGHVVMFAIRPFWRWQTQGSYFLGFNAILNWNDLDAGRTTPPARISAAGAGPQ